MFFFFVFTIVAKSCETSWKAFIFFARLSKMKLFWVYFFMKHWHYFETQKEFSGLSSCQMEILMLGLCIQKRKDHILRRSREWWVHHHLMTAAEASSWFAYNRSKTGIKWSEKSFKPLFLDFNGKLLNLHFSDRQQDFSPFLAKFCWFDMCLKCLPFPPFLLWNKSWDLLGHVFCFLVIFQKPRNA